MAFKALNDPSKIGLILKNAAYTYGPLLCWVLDKNQRALFGDWQLGLELLVLNGALTFAGLWVLSRPAARVSPPRVPM